MTASVFFMAHNEIRIKFVSLSVESFTLHVYIYICPCKFKKTISIAAIELKLAATINVSFYLA